MKKLLMLALVVGAGMTMAEELSAPTADGQQSLGGVQLWENGPYWAECNVGATKPEEAGYYFWWGDTVGYARAADNGGWVSVKDGTPFEFTREHCPTLGKKIPDLKSLGYLDAAGNLVSAYDAATAHLGAPWRMPTETELSGLVKNCTTTWTTRNGVLGRLVTGQGDYASKSIFLPAAGYADGAGLGRTSPGGNYWSSTPHLHNAECAWYIYFTARHLTRDYYVRFRGRTVRPLR